MKKLLATGICSLVLTGCAGGPFEWKYGRDKIVPGQHSIVANKGSVLTWPSYAVGAVVFPGGNAACIQSAQSAKARNSSGEGSANVKDQAEVHVGQLIKEAVASVQDKNDVATFVDVALFQICMISANQKLDNDQVERLVIDALSSSAEIAKARPNAANPTSINVTPPSDSGNK